MLLDAGAASAAGALAVAAQHGCDEMVDYLLARGYPPDDADEGVPTIAAAAACARLAMVENLLAFGAKEVDTALFCAAGRSLLSAGPDVREDLDARLSVIRALLAAGARPGASQAASLGATSLHVAAEVAVASIVDALLAAGADVEARDDLGRTPLYIAAENGAAEVAARLLRAGADPKTADTSATSAYEAAKKTSTPAILREAYPGRGDQLRVMALLRDAGAGPPAPPPAPPPKPAGPSAGDLVKHAKFGEGTIVSVEGKGAEAKLTIDFGAAGKKVLLARFVERR
jgi:hypothetical protein